MSVLTILIGAGASYDCVDRSVGVADYNDAWRPPLVNELFSSRPTFSQVLRHYPKAEALSGEIRRALNDSKSEGWLPLEKLLKKFMNDGHPQVRKRVREVPFYLQELLGEVGKKFITHGRSLFQELVSEVAHSIHQGRYTSVLFLTVNYDLLLDQELELLFDHRFRKMDDYTAQEHWKLIKLHGSVNWGFRISRGNTDSRESCLDHVAALDSEPQPATHEIVVLPNHQTYCKDGHFIYPAIAVPIADKSGFYCAKNLSKVAQTSVQKSTDFLILGCRLADQDVIDLFKQVETVNRLKIVDGGLDASLEILNRLGTTCPAFKPYMNNGQCLHKTGFRDFIIRKDLTRFLRGE